MREGARWGMGVLLPRLMAFALLADVGSRFLPVDPLTFRAWEALKRFRPPGAAFEPGRRYENPRSYGDLAAMGNLPELRQYRAESFSTDALGFRNAALPERGRLAGIVSGDSFAVGSGVNDDETLAAQLSRRLGCRFYNAGGIDAHPDRLLALARQLGLSRGLVLHEYQEDFDPPVVPGERQRRTQQALASLDPALGEWVGRARGFFTVSPLEVASQRAVKRLQDDRVLPNPFAGNVARRTLVTGDSMLFLPASIRRFREPRPANPRYWVWLRDQLEPGGLELVVLLVPSKYAVYRPFLLDDDEGVPGGRFLDELERQLRAHGIEVLNLSGLLARQAAQALAGGRYIYLLDDIHWNADGADVASAALADWLHCAGGPADPPRILASSGKP